MLIRAIRSQKGGNDTNPDTDQKIHTILQKSGNRVSENPFDNNYLDRMGLTHSRIWVRYRARAIKGIKANHKRS